MQPVYPGQTQAPYAGAQLQNPPAYTVPPSQMDYSKIDPNTLAAAMVLLQNANVAQANQTAQAVPQQIVLPNGDTYAGPLLNGVPHGSGELIYANHESRKRYIGELVQGVPNGVGAMIYLNGQIYEGRWENNTWHGHGDLVYPQENSGRGYTGQFANGKLNGIGTYIARDGRVYEGEHKDNVWSGRGTMTWPDGKRYEGMWENNNLHGEGRWTSADGNQLYIGQFANGRFNGHGRLVIRGTLKEELSGVWRDGKLWEGDKIQEFLHEGRLHEGRLHYAGGKPQGCGCCTIL